MKFDPSLSQGKANRIVKKAVGNISVSEYIFEINMIVHSGWVQ